MVIAIFPLDLAGFEAPDGLGYQVQGVGPVVCRGDGAGGDVVGEDDQFCRVHQVLRRESVCAKAFLNSNLVRDTCRAPFRPHL